MFVVIQIVSAITFTDSPVAPKPTNRYVRYATYLAVGDRIYTCDRANETSVYGLKIFDYDMYDAETDLGRKFDLGKHVFAATKGFPRRKFRILLYRVLGGITKLARR
jgi:hypothetical protein